MERTSRKSWGKESPFVADESEPEPSSSTSTSNGERKASASAPQGGSRRETRSSTATKAKVNEADEVKVKASAKGKDNSRTGDEVLEPPTTKSRNSGALGSPSASSWNSCDKAEINNIHNSQPRQNLFPFPTEIYEMIFKELKGPHLKDLHNVSNVIPEWRKLLKKDRVLFLFPKVFEILVQQGFTDFLPTPNDVRAEYNFLMYDLRLVCKSWNESIQSYVQLHPKNLHLEPFETGRWSLDDPESELRHIEEVYRFEDTEGITEFMEKCRSTHSREDNPFFGRMVHIQCWGTVNEEFWNAIRNRLLTYGKHIYYFKLTATFDDPMSPLQYIKILQRVLSLLPNIKTLRINYRPDTYDRTTKRERRQIVREIRIVKAQLPKLANLHVLETRNLPEVILQCLLQRYDHVKELKVQISRHFPIRLFRMFQQVAMSHEFEAFYISLRTREDIEDLQRTLGASPAWPVKSLFIPFSVREGASDKGPFFPVNRWPQWSSIFRLIEDKFGETLLNLMIHLPKTERDKDMQLLRDAAASTLRLNLPHLRELTVRIPNLTSVDFLLGVKDTLEELKVQVRYSDQLSLEERRREKIRFNGYFENMDKSNIWDVLPKLKRLLIEVHRNNRYSVSRWKNFSDSYSYSRTKSKGITKVNGD